jgi:hypothetical protein
MENSFNKRYSLLHHFPLAEIGQKAKTDKLASNLSDFLSDIPSIL